MANRYLLSYTFLLFFLLNSLCSVAQFSGVKWEHISDYFLWRNPSYFSKAVPTKDGEVYLVGETYSVSGIYLYQFVIQKINRDGSRAWEKIFINHDYQTSTRNVVVEASIAPDGGLIVLSRSHDYLFAGHHGTDTLVKFIGDGEMGKDVLVMKISAAGELLWRKFIGGKRMDHASGMVIDTSGNILISGTTYSADGDFLNKRRAFDSTNHYGDSARYPQFFYQSNDAFIAKLSSTGELINLRCYGGSKSDILSSIILDGQNGYFAGGSTVSTDFDVKANNIGVANWFVKIDTSLNLIAEHSIGVAKGFLPHLPEAHYLKLKRNGKLLFSNGIVSYEIDKSGNLLNGPLSLGLSNNDYFDAAENLYKIDSPYSNKKLIKFDSSLNLVWAKKIPGVNFYEMKTVAGDGGSILYLLGMSYREYEYEPYFKFVGTAIKYGETYNYVTGKIFADINKNGVLENGEKVFSGIKVEAEHQSSVTAIISQGTGNYYLPVDTGTYIVKPVSNSPYYTVSPVSKSVYFPSYNNFFDTINFALQPIGSKKDLSINLLPLNIARPGFPVQYQLICTNQGTETISNVQVKFLQNPRVSFVSSSPVANATVGDTLIWNIASMKPFDTSFINLDLRIAFPPTVNNTDTLLFKSFVYPLTGDETPKDNQFNLVQQVQGSYDPNDKTETHGGIITPEQLEGKEFLTYLIRFQNTGTDTAFTVMIRDTLTNKLDWSSFEMLSSSHPYQLYMIKPHILEFSFPNILLVDSNKNEPASHGFVAYRIKPKSNLIVGDTVLNRAHIYFDYNLPVITNDELTVLRNTVITSVIDIDRPENQLLLYPNPSNGLVTISKKARMVGSAILQITDMNGRQVYQADFGRIATDHFNQSIDISDLSKGLYVVKLQVGRVSYIAKFILR